MYARNNATPRPILLGRVVKISDGTLETSSVSIEVSKDGGSWSAGAGTTAVNRGEWSYVPTQGETDCETLRVVAYKTDYYSASAQVVFSASASFGHAGTDQSKIANPTSTQNLSGTTIKAVTDAVALPSSASINITGNITGNLSGSVGSVTGSVGSVTGNVAGSVNSVTSPVTVGTNNDKTGYALTQAFPSNFAALGINGSGHISRVTLVDTTTTNTDMRGTNNAALASNWTATRAGYLDSVLIAANSNRTVQVTGSHHVAADIHELQPAVIDNTHFAAGAIDSNALAASAATEIATAVGALTQLVDLTTMIVNDGTANARFSTSALQNAPSGGGGGGTGTGARTVVVTVALSASPVEGASVRLTKAAETYVGSTNASGQVTFNVDDGTWTVAITSPGATFAGASLVVDDDEAVSYSLTAISITPSPATQITGYYTCYSHLGVVEAGVSITMQLVGLAQGSVGLALDNRLRTVTSNASGVAQFTNLFPGCRYKVYRGAAENKAWYVNLPDTVTGDPVELGSIYGDDE